MNNIDFKSQYINNNFLEYLNTNDNGSYSNLVENITRIEKADTLFNLGCFLTRQNDQVIYEIPTNELCTVLAEIICAPIIEVGAGLGLLSARLQKYFNGEITTTSKYDNSFRINHALNYCSVSNFSFDEIAQCYNNNSIQHDNDKVNFNKFDQDKYQTILISWLHQSSQQSFLRMVATMQSKMIIHVGEHNESCYNPHFVDQMAQLGYKNFYLLPIKQISQIDYFINDKIRHNNCTRSCTTVFSKDKIDLLEDNFIEKLGKENFGTYLECSDSYVEQDCRIKVPLINASLINTSLHIPKPPNVLDSLRQLTDFDNYNDNYLLDRLMQDPQFRSIYDEQQRILKLKDLSNEQPNPYQVIEDKNGITTLSDGTNMMMYQSRPCVSKSSMMRKILKYQSHLK